METAPEPTAPLEAPESVDQAYPVRPARRRVTVLRLMGYVAASAVAYAFLWPSYATALAVCAGFVLFAPVSHGWARFELGMASGWLAGLVVAVSGVMGLPEALGFLYSAFLLGLAWLIRVPYQIVMDRSVRGLATLLVVPGVAALGVLAASQNDVALAARLATSESALLDAAKGVAEGQSVGDPYRPRWIGLMAVEGIERRDGIVLWHLGSEFLDSVGLAYLPDGKVPNPSNPKWPEYTFTHLRGRWWKYVHSF